MQAVVDLLPIVQAVAVVVVPLLIVQAEDW